MSFASDLYLYWQALPHGVGVTMRDMMGAIGAVDPQQVRQALTTLRKGYGNFPPLAVRHNSADNRYYDMRRIVADNVEQEVPGQILVNQIRELLTRAYTIRVAVGGTIEAAALLQYDEIRHLLAQIPVETIYDVEDTWREIGRARITILELEGVQDALQLDEGDEDEDEED